MTEAVGLGSGRWGCTATAVRRRREGAWRGATFLGRPRSLSHLVSHGSHGAMHSSAGQV